MRNRYNSARSVISDGLAYTRAKFCPWAGIFMGVVTKDKRYGRLVGFVRDGSEYRALVMIGKIKYVFDLDRIDWPKEDPLKDMYAQIDQIKKTKERAS